MNSQKGNILIIIPSIIVVVALIAAGFLFWQNQKLQNVPKEIVTTNPTPTSVVKDETANWKTYTSKCGFDFEHPSFWEVKSYFISDSENACGYLTGSDYTLSVDSRTGSYITFSRYLIGKDGLNTLDDFVHLTEKFIQPRPDPIKPVDKTVGGFNVKEFTAYGYEPGVSVAFLKENYIYNINRSIQTSEKLFNQILGTFKFLD